LLTREAFTRHAISERCLICVVARFTQMTHKHGRIGFELYELIDFFFKL
jgi:hypothetical protein